MNKTTAGYIVMILGSASILWAIVHLGSRLKAPADWSGHWTVVQPSGPNPNAGIQQSGRYLVLNLPGRPPESYKLEQEYGRLVGHERTLRASIEQGSWGTQLTLVDVAAPQSTIRLWREAGYAPR